MAKKLTSNGPALVGADIGYGYSKVVAQHDSVVFPSLAMHSGWTSLPRKSPAATLGSRSTMRTAGCGLWAPWRNPRAGLLS